MRDLVNALLFKFWANEDEREIDTHLRDLRNLVHVGMHKMPEVLELYSSIRRNLGDDMKLYKGQRFYDWFNRRLKYIDNLERIFLGYSPRND